MRPYSEQEITKALDYFLDYFYEKIFTEDKRFGLLLIIIIVAFAMVL